MELWYPKAVKLEGGKMKTNGKYAKGWPLGLVVHYDAGSGNHKSTIASGIKNGYSYFTMAKDGTVYQNAEANRWGSHAGKSGWMGLFDRVSDDLAGVEICCAGKLTEHAGEWYPHWCFKRNKLGKKVFVGGKPIALENRRYFKKSGKQSEGWYEKYTPQQEQSLLELIFWLKSQAPSVFKIENVVGHDETSLSGKTDPGGSLSMSMKDYRNYLNEKLSK